MIIDSEVLRIVRKPFGKFRTTSSPTEVIAVVVNVVVVDVVINVVDVVVVDVVINVVDVVVGSSHS